MLVADHVPCRGRTCAVNAILALASYPVALSPSPAAEPPWKSERRRLRGTAELRFCSAIVPSRIGDSAADGWTASEELRASAEPIAANVERLPVSTVSISSGAVRDLRRVRAMGVPLRFGGPSTR
jgi:hypothetical protein